MYVSYVYDFKVFFWSTTCCFLLSCDFFKFDIRHKFYIVKCLHFIVFLKKVLKFVLAQRFVVRLVVDQLDLFKDYFKLCQSVPRKAFYAGLATVSTEP